MCNHQMQIFLLVCRMINFPVSDEKTFPASTLMQFLGFLIDTVNQRVGIPMEKIAKGINMINYIIGRKKVTVLHLQKMCGFLNFLSRCILPGRAFTRRLYAKLNPNLKQHHHLRVTGEMRMDLQIWLKFLKQPEAYCRPFMDFSKILIATELDFYTDATKNPELGFSGRFNDYFMLQKWDASFIMAEDPSINYLELYAVTAAVIAWGHHFANRRVIIFCDNKGSCSAINKMTSTCRNSSGF